MKRKILIFVILLAGTGLLILQSCNKKEGTIFGSHYSFTDPVVVAPDDGATIDILAETTVDLQWESTNASGDAVLADVYFGTASNPPLYKANHNALTLNVPVAKGITYYWYVRMKDANGIPTISPIWSFTVFEPIGIFVGNYHTIDDGGYAYDLPFTKKSDNILQTEDYWDSAWHAEFTMNFVNNTFSMPLTVWGSYSAIESGTIDPETGTMTGTYTIYHPVVPTPVAIETGQHIYTKIGKK
jgi:hypothetical protein